MLRPTYRHRLSAAWSGPGGPWTDETLDDVLRAPPPVEAEVARVAGGLAGLGVGPGDAVAWQLANGPAPDLLFRASWRLGAVACPIHHRAGPADVARTVDRLGPRVLVQRESDVPTGTPVGRGGARADADAVAVALGTSGATGTPKVALHTHRSLVYKARSMAEVHRLGPDDCILLPAPMAHISGLLNGVLLTVSGLRVIPMARWDPAEALALMAAESVTFMIGPPTFFVSLIDAPSFSRHAVRALRQVSCGGAGVTPAFVLDASERLGARVKRSYGSTEAPTVTTSTLDDPPGVAATTDGRAVGAVELRVATDGPAELQIRGPELFAGYDRAEATAAAFTDDGWFRTGDLATIDGDGWLTIVGRMKDIIIRGGENIAAAEVEQVLEAHPDVRQAVAVGYPDARLGERVCAFVVARAPFDLTDCRSWFEDCGVTRFKWPERVEQVTDLPLLPSAKPDRAALRARLAAL